jgi:hypothetical protein
MEPFAKEIKEARKVYMRAQPSSGSFGKSGIVGTGQNANCFLPGSNGPMEKKEVEKRKACFQCGSIEHIARFCPRQQSAPPKRPRNDLKGLGSPPMDSNQ